MAGVGKGKNELVSDTYSFFAPRSGRLGWGWGWGKGVAFRELVSDTNSLLSPGQRQGVGVGLHQPRK